jgi:hypothetical protein
MLKLDRVLWEKKNMSLLRMEKIKGSKLASPSTASVWVRIIKLRQTHRQIEIQRERKRKKEARHKRIN